MKYQTLKDTVLGTTCRRCINQKYGLFLQTADCQYLPFLSRCSECGKTRNIVRDLRFSGRWRLLNPFKNGQEE